RSLPIDWGLTGRGCRGDSSSEVAARCGVGYQNETLGSQSAGQRSRARDTARNAARSVYTAASCALYAAEPDRSARNSSPSAARAAADLIAAGSAALPCSATSTPLARVTFDPSPVIAIRDHCTVFRASSEISAATPTTANREAGWGSFSYAPAVRAGGSGTRTWVRISPGSSVVVSGPTISCSTLSVRS